MTAYPTRQRNPSRKKIERALADVDLPLAKEDLVRCLEAQSGEPARAVLHQLRSLPLASYESVDEVLRSIDVSRGR